MVFDEEPLNDLADDFFFGFYCSFQTRTEVIGRDLSMGMHRKAEYFKKNNFKYTERVSDESKERWGLPWLKKEMA